MAHYQQLEFVAQVKRHFPAFFQGAKVLEVGSWIANATIREQFEACDYVGTDVAEGPGVNLAVPGQDLAFPTGSFDVMVSCQCFEHNPYWLETFLNMTRMLRDGGLFVFTCAGVGRSEHGTSRRYPTSSLTALDQQRDYYRNLSARDFESRIDVANHFSHYAFLDNHYSKDLLFVGFKRTAAPDPALDRQMAVLIDAASRITVEPGRRQTWLRALAAHSEWWVKWIVTRLMGEAAYHDTRYYLRRLVGTHTGDTQ